MRLLTACAPLCLLSLLVSPAIAQRALFPTTDRNAPDVPATDPAGIPVALDWTPPALIPLAQSAEVKNSFVLDRTMLSATAALLPDSEADAKHSIRKLDGVSIHLYRFQEDSLVDPAQVDLIRQSYHAKGWKHLVAPAGQGAPLHNGRTDLWLAMDGVNVRGGTLLLVTPRSVSLITFAGDLSPIDLLHLRGHFGIPNFSGGKFEKDSGQ